MTNNYKHAYYFTSSDSSIYSDDSDDKADSDIIKLAKTIENDLDIDDSLSIMTVNVSNAKKSGSEKAAERRNFVSTLINKFYPDIVLLQECIKKDFNMINNEINDDSKTVYTYYYYKDKQSGVMIKKRIKSTEIKVVETNLTDLNKLNGIGVKARLTLIKAEVEKDFEIIIGSWHGPNTEKHSSRQDVVKELCSYMETVSVGKPWIVGGDFNVPYKKIKDDISKDIKITAVNSEMIIYFLHTKTITLQNMNTLDKGDNNKEYLDHHPLLANIHI